MEAEEWRFKQHVGGGMEAKKWPMQVVFFSPIWLTSGHFDFSHITHIATDKIINRGSKMLPLPFTLRCKRHYVFWYGKRIVLNSNFMTNLACFFVGFFLMLWNPSRGNAKWYYTFHLEFCFSLNFQRAFKVRITTYSIHRNLHFH